MEIKKRGDLIKLLHEFNLPLTVVECGVAQGLFAQEMYNNWGLQKLILMDLWEEMPFISGCASFPQKWHDDNYKQVVDYFGDKEDVIILKGFSHKEAKYILDESIGLIYIDANHLYDGVKADIKTFWPKLVPGGIMAFHDYNDNGGYGVQRAVTEHMKGESGINIIVEDGNIENRGAWIRK